MVHKGNILEEEADTLKINTKYNLIQWEERRKEKLSNLDKTKANTGSLKLEETAAW